LACGLAPGPGVGLWPFPGVAAANAGARVSDATPMVAANLMLRVMLPPC
jgi:hypothetical protein